MRLGATGILCSLLWGTLSAGVPTTASAQEATPSVIAPQIENGTTAPVGAAAVYRRNALTLTDVTGRTAHIFPTIAGASAIRASATQNPPGPLLYNGGPVMPTIQIFNIFWKPAKLQTGAVANMSTHYMSVANGLAIDYAGHDISSNNTQYFQNINSVVTYVSGLAAAGSAAGSYGGGFLDVAAFPVSGCSSSATPGNCITDTQLQTELKRVMALKGWTGGNNKIYMIYTAQGEGSCFSSTGGSNNCAYTGYCAYHSSMTVNSTTVIYGNEPYGVPANCQVSGTPSPTGDPAADTAATAASHEITEAISDPLGGSGWTDSAGYEIGDICAYDYGANTYDNGKANQYWNGRYYELQREWDNHANACVQTGP